MGLPSPLQDEELVLCLMDPSLVSSGDPSGGVEAVRAVRDARTSKGKGIAFVLFKTAQACKVGVWLRVIGCLGWVGVGA